MSENLKEVVKAWLDGEPVQCRYDSTSGWLDKRPFEDSTGVAFVDGFEYRIKPRTVRIGEYDVPEPCRVKPKDGTDYFVPDLYVPEAPDEHIWNGDDWDSDRFERGLVHLTCEAAELHAKALISLTEVE